MANNTFDNKRLIKPLSLEDIDKAFYSWWNQKLDVHTKDADGNRRKVPVRFVSPERWKAAREEGVRDEHGTLILPIIAVTRTETSSEYDGGTGRYFADTKQEYTYAKEADKKSSIVKNLIESRPKGINPALPIYEVYTYPVPDHYSLTYEVSVKTSFIDQMNEIIQKVGQTLDFKSKKSFQFATPDGYYFIAFQEDILGDESNVGDFTGTERLIEKTYVFQVGGYILSDNDQRKSLFKRYFSQTKLIIKEQIVENQEELEKLFKK